MLWGSSLVEEDFEIIAPSRPGYLRTPLSAGRRPAEQADTLAALIDTLGIPGVAILASSSGARVAVEFAVRHPAKLWALVLVSAVAGEHEYLKSEAKPEGMEFPALAPDAFTNEIGGMLCLDEAERNPRPNHPAGSRGRRQQVSRGARFVSKLRPRRYRATRMAQELDWHVRPIQRQTARASK